METWETIQYQPLYIVSYSILSSKTKWSVHRTPCIACLQLVIKLTCKHFFGKPYKLNWLLFLSLSLQGMPCNPLVVLLLLTDYFVLSISSWKLKQSYKHKAEVESVWDRTSSEWTGRNGKISIAGFHYDVWHIQYIVTSLIVISIISLQYTYSFALRPNKALK